MKSMNHDRLRDRAPLGRGVVASWLCALSALACGVPAHGQIAGQEIEELDGVGIEQHLEALLPLDATFVDSSGELTTLGAYFDGEIPVILTLNYVDCPQLCSMQLAGLTQAMAQIGLSLGADYRVVTISIDPRDTPEKAAGAEERYVSDYLLISGKGEIERPAASAPGSGWVYLTGKTFQIDRVAETAGFGYRWIEEQGEYAHAAATILCSPKGVITRYLPGLGLDGADTLRLGLLEAGEGKIGTLFENAFLNCFIYDPNTGQYTLAAVRLLKVAAAVTALAVVCGIFFMRRGEAQRVRQATQPAAGAVSGAPDA
ncbi:MAG: SCO family protein [Planctomycetota bacterium]